MRSIVPIHTHTHQHPVNGGTVAAADSDKWQRWAGRQLYCREQIVQGSNIWPRGVFFLLASPHRRGPAPYPAPQLPVKYYLVGKKCKKANNFEAVIAANIKGFTRLMYITSLFYFIAIFQAGSTCTLTLQI